MHTTLGRLPVDCSEILFLQYTSGSTMEPKGVIATHENILDHLSAGDRPSVAGRRFVASAVSRYGADRMLFVSGTERRDDLRVRSHGFYSAPDPVVQCDHEIPGHCGGCPQLRLRLLPARWEASKESLEACDLSSLRVLMCAAEPVKPDTYTRFLEAFQPYGLKSESFYVAFGLAENTLAVSLGGRNIVSVNKRALALGKARLTTEVSEIGGATQIVSCGTPLPGLDLKIVDPEGHFVLKA